MTFLRFQFLKYKPMNKVKWQTKKHACWLWTQEKPVYRLKRSLGQVYVQKIFALFFSGNVFSQNMSREEMAKKVLYVAGLLFKSVLLCCTAAQQWEVKGQPEVSKFGMMLQGHIFKRITGAGLSDVCLRECYADVRCQSFNYVFTQDICELSNRTKEARPEDYVPNPERFYFKRDYKRGFYFFFTVFFPSKTFS